MRFKTLLVGGRVGGCWVVDRIEGGTARSAKGFKSSKEIKMAAWPRDFLNTSRTEAELIAPNHHHHHHCDHPLFLQLLVGPTHHLLLLSNPRTLPINYHLGFFISTYFKDNL